MNRRSFFNKFGVLIGAASLSPTIFIPRFEAVRWKPIVRPYQRYCIMGVSQGQPIWITQECVGRYFSKGYLNFLQEVSGKMKERRVFSPKTFVDLFG